ncbi:protein arginine N-methyltransferase 2, partial [Spea bombifrons]|uniref:protein arginine N-methyltransferase 2 n=1 Tax=Spea bombifrons TaxID=233779 RepID=UPI00234996A6
GVVGCRVGDPGLGPLGCRAGEPGLGPVGCRAGEDYRVRRSCVGLSESRGSGVNIGSPGSEEIELSAAPTELTAGQSSDTDALGVCSTDGDAEEDGVDDQCEKLQEFWMKCDYFAADDTQLTLFQGDKVSLINVVTPDWWWVVHDGSYGYVPSDCLSETDTEEVDDPWQDDEYYGSYQTLKLHLEMLSDVPRTETYREVIKRNRASLLGKHILDLGCGTGIISLFCAQLAQPKAVYAVEASKIAQQTRRLIEKNGFSNVVHVIDQRAEEMELPTKVDVLVSEWMGTCLLFEFMLESVLLARDFWLKEDGVMWPSTASIHLVPCSAAREYAGKVLFWDSRYQLDFSPLQSLAVKEFLSKPNPDYVLQPEDCLSDPCILLDVNLRTLQIADLERMSGNFTFCVKNDGIFHGFTAWFSVQFQNIEDKGWLELNTGPFNMLTHWKHTLFMLDEPVHVHKGDRIRGTALFQRNPVWRRHMSVTLSWEITSDAHDVPYEVGCKKFPMWR